MSIDKKCKGYKKQIVDMVYSKEKNENIFKHIKDCAGCRVYYEDVKKLKNVIIWDTSKDIEEEFQRRAKINKIISRVENKKRRRETLFSYLTLLGIFSVYMVGAIVLSAYFGTKVIFAFQYFAGLQLPLIILVVARYQKRSVKK